MPAKTTVKSKKKVTSKKKSNSNAKSKSINQSQPKSNNTNNFFYGSFAIISTYVLGLWAIDSGSLWVYALAFAALYYTIHFYRLFIRNKFFNNDKLSKARTAKS
jgi:hypothetical protein